MGIKGLGNGFLSERADILCCLEADFTLLHIKMGTKDLKPACTEKKVCPFLSAHLFFV